MSDRKKIRLGKDHSIDFYPTGEKKNYGFVKKTFENEMLVSTIHYEIEVLSKENNQNLTLFELNRKQIYINNLIPNSRIEQIVDEAALTIFPIKINVDNYGKIIKILNFQEIENRWIATKKHFLSYYKNEMVYKIIEKTDFLLLNEKALCESLYQNWFFYLYFKPLYISYTETLRKEFNWQNTPIFGNRYLAHKAIHTIDEFYTEDDKIIITITGEADEERSIEDILEGYNFPKSKFSSENFVPAESKMEVTYKLYAEDRNISSVVGTFETKINENKFQKIEIEIYHLTEISSYKPHSDFAAKESQRIFDSFQKFDDDESDIIDFREIFKNKPSKVKEPNDGERIELFIEETTIKKKIGFWQKFKKIFR